MTPARQDEATELNRLRVTVATAREQAEGPSPEFDAKLASWEKRVLAEAARQSRTDHCRAVPPAEIINIVRLEQSRRDAAHGEKLTDYFAASQRSWIARGASLKAAEVALAAYEASIPAAWFPSR